MKDFSNYVIDDSFILSNFIDKNGNVSGPKCKCIYSNPNVDSYLLSRYPDLDPSVSYQEIIYRIQNNIEEVPKCPICGKPRKFRQVVHYLPTCGDKSCIYQNIQQTFIDRYGGTSGFGNKNTSEKIKQSLIENFGVDNPMKSQDIWSSRLSKQTTTSKEEDDIFEILKEEFPNIIRQHKDSLYPFNCDFYLPDFNLYIEYHGSMFHYGRRFNKDLDIDVLNNLMLKCDSIAPNRYNSLVYTWVFLDPKKLQTAISNKLNYLIIYPYILGSRNKLRSKCLDKNKLKDFLLKIIYNFKNMLNTQLIIGENI